MDDGIKAIGAIIGPDQVWPMFVEGALIIVFIFLLLAIGAHGWTEREEPK